MSDSKNSKTPISMWPVLEYKNFETKKLQQAFENEGTYKENVPVFDGEGGKTGNAEAFLYVQERFNSVSNRYCKSNVVLTLVRTCYVKPTPFSYFL